MSDSENDEPVQEEEGINFDDEEDEEEEEEDFDVEEDLDDEHGRRRSSKKRKANDASFFLDTEAVVDEDEDEDEEEGEEDEWAAGEDLGGEDHMDSISHLRASHRREDILNTTRQILVKVNSLTPFIDQLKK